VAWRFSGRRLTAALWAFTVASFVPFVFSLSAPGSLARRAFGSATTARVTVAPSGQRFREVPPDHLSQPRGQRATQQAAEKGDVPLGMDVLGLDPHLGPEPGPFEPDPVAVGGRPETPGAFYRGMRTMALDGFVVDVPDTPANARAFGRPGSGRAPGAFPQARILALCETGSHVLWRSLIKPYSCGEVTMAHSLLRSLREDMLLLWDRNFLSYQTASEVRRRKANLLARIKKNLVFEPIRLLDDGSYLSKMYRTSYDRQKDRNGILVRIIEYTFEDPGRAGSGEPHRLLTTLLDEKLDPAETLIVLYHERWEEELTIDELKTHQRERAVLRSQTPGGVVQELYGFVLGHYVIRVLMQEAAATQGIDPHRLSFTATLKILRCRLPECPASDRGLRRWYHNLVAEVAEEVLEERRNRINPRVIKRKMSNWKKKRPEHRNYPQPTKAFAAAIVMRR
jgi:hypothetical protein